jgi:propanediol dehydratase small subunit
VSYIHLAINVDFSSIRKACDAARHALDDYDQRVTPTLLKNQEFIAIDKGKVGSLSFQYEHAHQELMKNRRTKLLRINTRLDDIQNALPLLTGLRRGLDAKDVATYLSQAAPALKTVKTLGSFIS